MHEIQRFGDQRYGNKAAQLDALYQIDFDRAVLLDTDMIAVSDIRTLLPADRFAAKVVDCANPSMTALQEIASQAGLAKLPEVVPVDAGAGFTYQGNCNGGLYSIPKPFFRTVAEQWRYWLQWLLQNDGPLRREGKQMHADQVAMWLAIQSNSIPYEPLPANANYFVHMEGSHNTWNPNVPIAMLHYHDAAMNVLGMIEPPCAVTDATAAAVAQANLQIGQNFDNRVFWDFRYNQFPERGSGVGSRGSNLMYKRRLLASLGIERAESVLDVGCGDLEVLKEFRFKKYLGLDQSGEAIQRACAARPELNFRLADVSEPATEVEIHDMVLSFEVAIHQQTKDRYLQLIDFLASKTGKDLIVSGYEGLEQTWAQNHMLFFYEPLSVSLARTKRFREIRAIGSHSDVTVFHCRV